MTAFTIYHNPRCSKSRQTLALLEENGITPTVVRYLEDTPDAASLKKLVQQLGLARAHDLVRHKEADYATAGLSVDSDDDTVLKAMAQYPKLIERPIVVVDKAVAGKSAVLGRPPENVLRLIDAS